MFGLNDGLVASFAVTSGIAERSYRQRVAIMAGLSEMLGGAVSMGLAAFISARSQIEFYQSEIEREREEIRRWPDREREEISAIYRNEGVRRAAARSDRRAYHGRPGTMEQRHDARGVGLQRRIIRQPRPLRAQPSACRISRAQRYRSGRTFFSSRARL